MKRLCFRLFIIISIFLVLTLSASDGLIAQELKIRVIKEGAELRVQPDSGSTIIRELPLGSTFEYENLINGWFKILLPPDKQGIIISGYVHPSFVEIEKQQATKTEFAPEPAPIPEPESTPKVDPTLDIAGKWHSSAGGSIQITQTGNEFTLIDDDNVEGTGTINDDTLTFKVESISWEGKIIEYDENKRPVKIKMPDYDVVLTREGSKQPQPAPEPLTKYDISGEWNTNEGGTYKIIQTGSEFVWVESDDVSGTGTISGDTITFSVGSVSLEGKITGFDANNQPTKISLSDNVSFTRAGDLGAILKDLVVPMYYGKGEELKQSEPPPEEKDMLKDLVVPMYYGKVQEELVYEEYHAKLDNEDLPDFGILDVDLFYIKYPPKTPGGWGKVTDIFGSRGHLVWNVNYPVLIMELKYFIENFLHSRKSVDIQVWVTNKLRVAWLVDKELILHEENLKWEPYWPLWNVGWIDLDIKLPDWGKGPYLFYVFLNRKHLKEELLENQFNNEVKFLVIYK